MRRTQRCVSPEEIVHAYVPSAPTTMLLSTRSVPAGSALVTMRPSPLTPPQRCLHGTSRRRAAHPFRAHGGAAIAGGTLRYASPEDLTGRPADGAYDVWSLCVILYETASGEHPFADGGVDEVTRRLQRRRDGADGRWEGADRCRRPLPSPHRCCHPQDRPVRRRRSRRRFAPSSGSARGLFPRDRSVPPPIPRIGLPLRTDRNPLARRRTRARGRRSGPRHALRWTATTTRCSGPPIQHVIATTTSDHSWTGPLGHTGLPPHAPMTAARIALRAASAIRAVTGPPRLSDLDGDRRGGLIHTSPPTPRGVAPGTIPSSRESLQRCRFCVRQSTDGCVARRLAIIIIVARGLVPARVAALFPPTTPTAARSATTSGGPRCTMSCSPATCARDALAGEVARSRGPERVGAWMQHPALCL